MTTHRLLLIPTTVSILLALSAAANAQFKAAPGSPFAVGLTPVAVAVGDFNGDGKADLAVANQNDNTLTVLLGNGTGGFTAAPGSPLGVGLVPQSVAVGDFNGDGKADLVVSDSDSNSVTVLLSNGAGGFTAAPGSPVATGLWPHSVVVADFNGDGKLDLAVADTNANTVTVLLGKGTGGFMAAPGSPFAVAIKPTSVAVGDFNGDGKPDLAIANNGSNNITVMLGTGTGAFTAAPGSPFATGNLPVSVAVGDFNGDSKLDLAIVNQNDDNVTVLLGSGTGGFTAAIGSPFLVGHTPASVAVGDFNGDSKLDLAVANQNDNTVTVLLGNGTGGFTTDPASPFPTGAIPASVAVGDFNKDGKPDLAIANSGPGNVSVLLNAPGANLIWQNNATTQVTVNYFGGPQGATYTGWNWLNSTGVMGWHVAAVADFDNNGTADLIWQNNSTGQVTVNFYGGSGGATYQGWCWLNVNSNVGWNVVGAADFNGDGVPDLIWQNEATRQVTVNYYGGAQGCTYSGWNWLNAAGVPGWTVAGAADFNRDGVPDLIWQNDTTAQVTVNYYGGVDGAVYQGWNWLNQAGVPGWTVEGAADFNGDDVPDLVWANDATGQVTVNYYGGTGGAVYQGWNWLNEAGVPGWHTFASGKP